MISRATAFLVFAGWITAPSSSARARIDSQAHMSVRASSRNAFEYLKAMQKWKVATRGGISCPPPNPCTCHCVCPDTVFQKAPPGPPPCPSYLSFPTLPPPPPAPSPPPAKDVNTADEPEPEPNTTPPPTTPPPKPPPKTCEEGQVARADGTCSDVTPEIIEEVKQLVFLKKHILDDAQLDYKAKMAICPKCNAPPVDQLLHDHVQYRRALDLLLALLGMLKDKEAEEPPPPPPAEEEGPEYVRGTLEGHGHCEAWTNNGTKPCVDEECGVICRHQPSCVGFAIDHGRGICIWYDKFPPLPEDKECTMTPVQFVKKRNVTQNKDIWAANEKVHAMEEQLETMMITADAEAQDANHSFSIWMHESNETLKELLKYHFVEAKDNYTFTLLDSQTILEEKEKAIEDAWALIHKDSADIPAFTTTTTTTTPAVVMEPVETTVPPETSKPIPTPTPLPIEWKDFPNAEDSQWAARHPECPQGPPCWCDCKCRGSPPQNFVEPVPPPPAPCPPFPPTPDPSRLSTPLGAPPNAAANVIATR